ncbi:MAG: hypothetical protein PX635_03650 [Nostocales cyanobacterium LE14-WE12]|jgi:hypothetical protein|nr:hypothetical protein [Nostocales cyanobacterium LE14-WE12]
MKYFKIHPNTLSVGYPNGVLTDKTKEYPEDLWEEGIADQLVKTGFLVEVKKTEVKKK